jgi:hypothetical protein
MMPLCKYLLPEDDALLRLMHQRALSNILGNDSGSASSDALSLTSGLLFEGRPAKRPKTGREPKWIGDHIDNGALRGKPWWSIQCRDRDTLALFPGLACLSDRAWESLILNGVEIPERKVRTVDVSQKMTRQNIAEDIVHAITPTGMKYLTHRCRLLHGLESLWLQSLPFTKEDVAGFPETLLRDLSGNAFEASCCAAALFMQLVFISSVSSRSNIQVPGMRKSPSVASGPDQDDLDVDDSASWSDVWVQN